MEKILGLDLGTNSIGWAIREINNDLENQIIDKGVLTFDKGVADIKGEEFPMVQKRTESRGKRRNYQGEKYRKWGLLQSLIENKMCPLTIEELNEWRHYTKGIGRKYPRSEKFIQWLRFDFDADGKPDFERLGFSKHESYYLFRALIIDESKVNIFKNEPQIIGRVLYQLVQRRGYNDGQNIDENEKDELSKTIMKGGGDAGAIGVNEIVPHIKKHRTLGAALYYIQKGENIRIRKRYNLRSDYENEIREICRVQGLEHLLKLFWGAIIWQRPLRGQKGLVGNCTFEQNKRRCPISHPLYEEYRTWVFINNLRIKPIIQNEVEINKMPLHEALHTIVYPQFFKAAVDFKLSSITKELKKAGFEITSKFPEDTKIISLSFLYRVREIFGDNWETKTGWTELLNGTAKTHKYNIEDLWHLHFAKKDNKDSGETAFDFLCKFAQAKLHLEEAKAEIFAKIRLQQGYATLSINAIRKILPYLKQGFIYSEAIYLANLHKVIGVEKITQDVIAHFSEEIRKIIKQNSLERKLTQVVNELISDQLNSEVRFGMDVNYQLDNDDKNDIQKKLLEVFGNYSWQTFNEAERETAIEYVSGKYLAFLQKRIHAKNVFEKTERLHDKIFNWVKRTYNVADENIKHLWHPSEQEIYEKAKFYQEVKIKNQLIYIEDKKVEKFIKENPDAIKGEFYGELLGSPEPISKGFKNPMALKTLHKLKRLINYLIGVGKVDNDTRVVIEIARELNDANKRKAIERWQREREKENDIFKNKIDEINKECNTNFNREDKSLIDKIRLWEEQKRICIYTGKTIGLCDVLNGVKYDFEHSIPASMSFDNELKNLTIADSYYNREIKKKRIPHDCSNYNREYVHEGTAYPSILSSLQNVFGRMREVEKKIKGGIIKKRSFEKIEQLEEQYAEWKAKTSEDKQIKDNIIIRRHLIKMELDYWRYKLHTFTTNEYKSSWRNSQLRDTQTITKYALPYLKTVFNKVEVQKGNITADFRKIYKIQHRLEKKERTKHSHHAIDAAVLTLIPVAAIRDKILLRYNEANEIHHVYHEKPRQWNNFHQQHILNIEDDVLINYQAQHRTLTHTYKTVRKRGEIQYVKEKLLNGKWQYKLNKNGNRIPVIAQGDTIRGGLHEESFMGLIKQPIYDFKNGKYIPQNDGKGKLVLQQKNDNDELFVVKKISLLELDNIDKFKKVVDPNLRDYLVTTIETRINSGLSFKQAILEPIWSHGKKIDKNGDTISPIRHIRCRVAKAAGFLSKEKTLAIRNNDFISKHSHKREILAGNDEMVYCLYYEQDKNKCFKLVSRFDVSVLKIQKINDFFKLYDYNELQKGKHTLPLNFIIQAGKKVILLDENFNDIEALKELEKTEPKKFLKRIYMVNNFNIPSGNTIYIYLINHIDARSKDILQKEEEKNFNPEKYQAKLALTADKFICAIEGKHFETTPNGVIKWKF